ncbi:putative ribonuclease H-like domain-containing protein [Tanacetum coccineum]|uniref:Ribonuclease H-like domain-containing protein n=1 Tax=Tanacetum coccineum TaxID=301880 RepID=A0ABQ5FD18_9ASTR
MQEELLQFKLQQVWILVDLPIRKRAIGTKWVFRNKKDERGIVIRNKARIEAIRLFLAYASFMGFLVYQMDVKSAFLYETIEEEVCVTQPLGFKDPDHPDKVYKVVKALYGLHQAPRAWYETLANYLLGNRFKRGKIDQTLFIKKQKGDILLVQVYVDDIIFGSTNKELCTGFEKLMKDKFQMSSMGELTFFLGLQVQQKEDGIFISQDKYVAEILKKFNYTDVKSASTPVDLEKPLVKDGDADDVDVHLYRSMIGSLMYLTTSRPDIMFAVCACARFQVTPKTSHLLAVKRIFRYLKGKPTLGLWYSRDSPFELVAYTDSDYAGATQDRKSTTRAEYVAAASCCGQVLWIQNQLLDYGYNFMNTVINIDINNLLTKGFDAGRFHTWSQVGNEAVHKELGDRMERVATTTSSLEAEQDSDAQTRFETTSKQSNDPPVSKVNTFRSGEDIKLLLPGLSLKLLGASLVLPFKFLSVELLVHPFPFTNPNLHSRHPTTILTQSVATSHKAGNLHYLRGNLHCFHLLLGMVGKSMYYARLQVEQLGRDASAAWHPDHLSSSTASKAEGTAYSEIDFEDAFLEEVGSHSFKGSDVLTVATKFRECPFLVTVLATLGSDASIRKRALKLDSKGRSYCQICSIVEKLSPDKLWYIDHMLKVLCEGFKNLDEAGNYVKDEVWHALVVITNASNLHGYTVWSLYRAIQTSIDMDSAKLRIVNRDVQIQALIDGKKIIVNKASIRCDLKLEDAEGSPCLPNATIFEELTRMGSKTTAWNEFNSTMASAIICLANNQKFNFSKYIFDSMVPDLEKAKSDQAIKIASLKKRVEKLERRRRFRTTRLQRLKKVGSARIIESSDDSLGAQEDAFKQGRSIRDIDADVGMFVDATIGEKDEQSKKIDDSTTSEAVTTAGVEDSDVPTIPTTVEETLAQTLMEIKAAKPKAKGIVFHDLESRPLTKKDQVALDEDLARNIQAQLDAEIIEEERLERQKQEEANIALIES